MSNVFMSHSSDDKPIVRRLAGRIKDAGHTVWLDEEQLHIGDSLVDGLGESVTTADFVVVALSPSSVASPWVRQELNAALADQIERSQTKVLPVVVGPCEIPPLLRDRIYADVSQGRRIRISLVSCRDWSANNGAPHRCPFRPPSHHAKRSDAGPAVETERSDAAPPREGASRRGRQSASVHDAQNARTDRRP